MKISANELLTTVGKAFEGLGFAPGDREDAAAMVAWLELHGLNGLAELEKALDFLDQETDPRPRTLFRSSGLRVFDAGGASVLAGGALAVDAGVAMARHVALATVRLEHCHNRLLIIGYLARSASLGVSVLASWGNARSDPRRYVASLRAGDGAPTLRAWTTSVSSGDVFDQGLTLVFSRNLDLLPQLHLDEASERVLLSVEGASLDAAEAACIEHGITVDDALWQRLGILARRVLVAASEQSRRGAGELSPGD